MKSATSEGKKSHPVPPETANTLQETEIVVNADRNSPTPQGDDSLRVDGVQPPPRNSVLRSIVSTIVTCVKYTYADVRSRPRNTIIGAVAVLILVFFSGLVLTALDKTPYIILRLAELNAGEADFSFETDGAMLNYSYMERQLASCEAVRGISPRWTIKAELDAEPKLPFFNLFDPDRTPSTAPRTTTVVLVADTEKEMEIGIGRDWKYRPTGYGEVTLYRAAAEFLGVRPQRGERVSFTIDAKTLLSSASMDIYVTVPEVVNVSNDLISSYIRSFIELNQLPKDRINLFDLLTASFSAVVVNTFDSPEGKYPSALGNVALLDYQQLISLLLEESCLYGGEVGPKDSLLYPTWNPDGENSTLNDAVLNSYQFSAALRNMINDFRLGENAMSVLTVLRDRYQYYYAETSTRARGLIAATNSLMTTLGVDFDASFSFSLSQMYEQLDIFKVLVVTSFATVVAAMIVLGVILLLTLLRINAEERQYEIAMMRAQGMPTSQIGGLLAMQTMTFAIPATAIGILCVFLFNIIIEALLSSFSKAPANYWSFPVFVPLFCLCEGLLMPLIATWPSIRKALSTSLRDALDIYRQENNETTVKMIKLAKLGLEKWELVVGIFLVVAGFVVYYLIPVSFVFQKFMLFFFQLDFVLCCMVVGLCLMVSVVQTIAQRLLLRGLLWGPDRRLLTLIEKNLSTHHETNKNAFMMFLLSVGCLCAGGIMFSVLASISTQLSELAAGSHISISSVSTIAPLNETTLNDFLSTIGSGYVLHWAYASFPLGSHPSFGSTSVRNAVGVSFNLKVTALSEYFMESTYDAYNMIEELNPNYRYETDNKGKAMVLRSMYDDIPTATDALGATRSLNTGKYHDGTPARSETTQRRPVIPILIGNTVKDRLGTGVEDNLFLSFYYSVIHNKDQKGFGVETHFTLQPRALMKRVSGFFLISPLTFSAGTILVTTDSFQELLNASRYDLSEEEKTQFSIPKNAAKEVLQQKLFIRLRPNVTKSQREHFTNIIQPVTDVTFHTTVDTVGLVEDLEAVRDAILYFFYFIAVICTVLCAFMMWMTFIANVQLHLWTYGVLRSLGFTNSQLIRACIYEALSIVVAAFLGGLGVGCAVGLSVAAQFSTFMSLPYTVQIPYTLILLVLGLCLAAAVIGSAIPLWVAKKRSIASVIKGV